MYFDTSASFLAADPDFSQLLNAAGEYLRAAVVWLLQFETVNDAVAWISAPGLLLFEELHLPSTGENWQLAAFIIGYLFWLRVTRILWFTFARPFGLGSAEQMIFFRRLGLPYEPVVHGLAYIKRLLRQWRFGKGPSGYWAGFWTMASYPFNPAKGGIPLGRLPLFQRFGLHMACGLPDCEKSIAVIASSGSGKSAWIAYWLGNLHRSQSAAVFDMDGMFTRAFAAVLQAAGRKVVKIDIDKIDKSFPCGKYNPMRILNMAAKREGNAAVSAYAKLLAEALIVDDSSTQPVFARTARVIIKALILFVWLTEPIEKQSLLRVRQLLTRGLPERIEQDDESAFGRLIFEMSILPARYDAGDIDDGCGGFICNEIAECCGLLSDGGGYSTDANSPDNFRKTALYQTDWCSDANVAAVIGGDTDISGEELKLSKKAPVCFMVSTLTDTQIRLAPFVRAWTMLTIYEFQKVAPEMKLRHPCCLILDEYPQLGKGLDICAVAAPGFRKLGLKLTIISQSIGLLREASPDRYLEFLNQAACVIWMGIAPTDKESLDYLTGKVLGQCTRKEKIDGWTLIPWMLLRCIGLKVQRARYQLRPQFLLTPQQASAFLDRSTGQIIVTFEGGRPPWRLQRLLYWKELPVWKYAASPAHGHGEKFLRSQTRFLISQFSKGSLP